MNRPNRRGVLACAALLLVLLTAVFPLLPAYGSSAAALTLLEKSRQRFHAMSRRIPLPDQPPY